MSWASSSATRRLKRSVSLVSVRDSRAACAAWRTVAAGDLVDLAALDPDEAILDVIDPPDAVGAGELVDALDEGDRVEPLAVEADRNAALELEQEVDRRGRVRRGHGPRVGIGRRRGPGVLEDARLAGAAPHVDVDGVGARLRDRELDAARGRVVDRLVAREAHADPHRRDDLEGRVQRVDRDVEADLVVALARAAVRHGVGALRCATSTRSWAMSGRARAVASG